MTRDDIHKVIEEFLALVETGQENVEQNEKALAALLDKIALASRYTDHKPDEEKYVGAPKEEAQSLRRLICSRFPNFGYYNLPENFTTEISESGIVVGDAIDDILDITLELKGVEWCWQNISVDNALWCFRNGFDTHWGLHLRELQLYLLALERGL